LAQRRIFFSRRIAQYAFPLRWEVTAGQAVQKFFLSFQKSSATRHMRIFRGSLYFAGTVFPCILFAGKIWNCATKAIKGEAANRRSEYGSY
jgi:hypothetical protein